MKAGKRRAAHHQVTAERDADQAELARLRAEGEAKDRALKEIAEHPEMTLVPHFFAGHRRWGFAWRSNFNIVRDIARTALARAATAREMALALQGSQTAPASKGCCAPLRGFALDCPALVGGRIVMSIREDIARLVWIGCGGCEEAWDKVKSIDLSAPNRPNDIDPRVYEAWTTADLILEHLSERLSVS